MPLPSLLLYVLSLAVMVIACWLALGLVRTFRLHFLSPYLGYLVAINTAGLLNLAVTDLSLDVLKDIPPPSMQTIYILFGLAAFPLLAIAFYFYLTFVSGILDQGLSLTFRTAYIILWTVLLTGFLIRIQLALQQKVLPIAQALNLVFASLVLFIPIAALVYLMLRTARGPWAEGRKGLIKFAVVSLVCYILFFVSFSLPQPGSSFRWIAPICLLLANVSPILVLRRILRRYGRPILPEMFGDPRMNEFRERFQLSPREGEILDLLLKGKSNKDIERELFVSPHTVRNHVHNIYQKLGVGSRLQLLNLMRTWMEPGPVR